jgi:molybdopterin-guanine dinucleotide biosynthesis protein A
LSTRPRLLGAVLAGGQSRRLGRDKASEFIHGISLVERAAAVLEPTCSEVIVVSSRPDTRSGRWELISDQWEDCGPLGGIEAALSHAAGRGYDAVFLLACDLPLVDARIVETIVAAAGDAAAAAPERGGMPGFEPLCALYKASCLAAARELLVSGTRMAQALFSRVDGVLVASPRAVFLNVNTQEDLDRARATLTSTGE